MLPLLRRRLLEGGIQQQQQGLALLVQFAGPLLAEHAASGSGPGQAWSGVQHDPAFWQLVRVGLQGGDASSRKRATHVLAAALAAQAPDGQLAPAWQSYLKLLDSLDEMVLHLVKASPAFCVFLCPAAECLSLLGPGACPPSGLQGASCQRTPLARDPPHPALCRPLPAGCVG